MLLDFRCGKSVVVDMNRRNVGGVRRLSAAPLTKALLTHGVPFQSATMAAVLTHAEISAAEGGRRVRSATTDIGEIT